MTENERVRVVRKSEKLTLEEFGKRLGVTRGAVSAIENAVRGLTDQMCRSICREFGVREEWLRTGEGAMREESPSDELDAVLDKWNLPREFRGLFLAYGNLRSDAERAAVRRFVRDAAEEIARQTANAPQEPKNVHDWTQEEMLAEVDRQFDAEEKETDEPSTFFSGSSGTAIA